MLHVTYGSEAAKLGTSKFKRAAVIVFKKSLTPLYLILYFSAGFLFNSASASTLLFSDDFDDVALNDAPWQHYQPGEKFDGINSDRTVGVNNGVLAISSFTDGGQNLTGSISFKPSFTAQNGYLEIRTRFPKLREGKQCSISLNSPLFGNKNIDENLAPENTGSVITLARFASSWGGAVSADVVWGNWSDKKQISKGKLPFKMDDGEFHTFGLELNSDSYTFYLDGKKYWETDEGISGVPMYLVINCEIKSSLGDFAGLPSDEPFEIDYVKLFDAYEPEALVPTGTVVVTDDWDIRNGDDNIAFGDFRKDAHFLPSQHGDFDAIRVTLKKGTHLGTDTVFKLPSGTQEAWVQYCMMFADSWQAKTAGKLPGFSGNSGKWFGGQGGSPSTGNNAWSARMLYGEYEPKTRSVPIGQYVYHADQGKISEYGDPDWWSLTEKRLVSNSARVKNNQWVSIKQHLKMNTADENDGLIEAWLDGELAYLRDDFNFTNSWLHRKITRFWLDIYYGGGPVAESDQVVYFDQFNYSVGSEDNTSTNCQ